MREIKFRGLDKQYNVWRFGSLVEYDNGQSAIVFSAEGYGRGVFTNEVIPETVGQYTGLKDRDGVEIYEGDILVEKDVDVLEKFTKVDGSEWSRPTGKREDRKHTVFFDEKKAQFTTKDCWLWSLAKSVKIIGNIHDKPELMGDKE